MKKTSLIGAAVLAAAALVAVGAVSPALAKSSVTVIAPIQTVEGDYDYYGYSAVSPDGSLIAVSVEYAGVTIYNVATGTQHDMAITAFGGTTDLGFAVFSPDNKWLYVADYTNSRVIVIDLSDYSVDRYISGDMSNTWNLAISPDGTKLFARDNEGGLIYKFDLANSDTKSGPVNDTGSYNSGMCISADGSRLFSPTFSNDSIAVINTANMTVSAQWAAPEGSGPKFCTTDNEGNLIIGLSGTDSVAKYAVDGTYTVSADDIASGLSGVAASCDTVYLSHDGSPYNEVATADLSSLVVGTSVSYARADESNAYTSSASRSADGSVIAIGGYYSENGLIVILSPECAAAPALADTGTGVSTIATSVTVSLGLLVAGALALVVIRRRKV